MLHAGFRGNRPRFSETARSRSAPPFFPASAKSSNGKNCNRHRKPLPADLSADRPNASAAALSFPKSIELRHQRKWQSNPARGHAASKYSKVRKNFALIDLAQIGRHVFLQLRAHLWLELIENLLI